MDLIHKLNAINIPRISPLPTGETFTIESFWDSFICPSLPSKDTMLAWHDLLMNYITYPDAVFAIRGFNNAPPDRYDDLRRGFLTRTNKDYSFFYTDNFHAAYYLKMTIDGFVPTSEELLSAYKERLFPCRFGRDTSNERMLMGMPKGKDPGIQNAGYKIAHIFNVGKDYHVDNNLLSLSEIIGTYFPRGERTDWRITTDNTGQYYIRFLEVPVEARKYIIAEFLRFVHPFNYFLAPKSTCSVSPVCKDIAEHPELIKYVKSKFKEMYGDKYQEFLELIMADTTEQPFASKYVINLKYGLDINKAGITTQKAPSKHSQQASILPQRLSTDYIGSKPIINHNNATLEDMVLWEYLINPSTSFRKLETTIMKIDSPARGGGFKAKKIVNDHGFTASDKGLLSQNEIKNVISISQGIRRTTLKRLHDIFADK